MIEASVMDGGHRNVLAMILLLAVADTALMTSPMTTVAMTLSLTSVFAVGGLIFKAGQWRGEHMALREKVSDNYAALEKRLDEKFLEIRQDIHDLRRST